MSDITIAVTGQNLISLVANVQFTPDVSTAGNVASKLVAGENLALGDVCYVKVADGRLWKGRADLTMVEASVSFICSQVGGILGGASGLFSGCGFINGLTGGAIDSPCYLSAVAGGRTTVVPTTGYSKLLGRYVSPTVLFFMPDWSTKRLT